MRGIEEDLQKIEIKVCKFSVDVNSATQYIHDTISNQEELVEKLTQLDYQTLNYWLRLKKLKGMTEQEEMSFPTDRNIDANKERSDKIFKKKDDTQIQRTIDDGIEMADLVNDVYKSIHHYKHLLNE